MTPREEGERNDRGTEDEHTRCLCGSSHLTRRTAPGTACSAAATACGRPATPRRPGPRPRCTPARGSRCRSGPRRTRPSPRRPGPAASACASPGPGRRRSYSRSRSIRASLAWTWTMLLAELADRPRRSRCTARPGATGRSSARSVALGNVVEQPPPDRRARSARFLPPGHSSSLNSIGQFSMPIFTPAASASRDDGRPHLAEQRPVVVDRLRPGRGR